jgi:hypothetical protein
VVNFTFFRPSEAAAVEAAAAAAKKQSPSFDSLQQQFLGAAAADQAAKEGATKKNPSKQPRKLYSSSPTSSSSSSSSSSSKGGKVRGQQPALTPGNVAPTDPSLPFPFVLQRRSFPIIENLTSECVTALNLPVFRIKKHGSAFARFSADFKIKYYIDKCFHEAASKKRKKQEKDAAIKEKALAKEKERKSGKLAGKAAEGSSSFSSASSSSSSSSSTPLPPLPEIIKTPGVAWKV